MRSLALILAAAAAFWAGAGLAPLAPGGEPPETVAKVLQRKQRALRKDLSKIEKAASDILELRAMRESGKYILNSEEKKLEKQGRMDFHIFMERIRNNTLEVLALLDGELGREAYVDPLKKIFGKALYKAVQVGWDEAGLEDIVDDLKEGYGVDFFIKGDIDVRRTMSLRGNMTLLAILLQIENVYDAKLIVKKGHLWFVRVAPPADVKKPTNATKPHEKKPDDPKKKK